MLLRTLSAWLKTGSVAARQRTPKQRCARGRFRPQLKALEDRCVPSYVFHTIDAPNAGSNGSNGTQGTFACEINDSGVISGNYGDANNVTHGFLLEHGKFTTLNDPNAGTAASQGTAAFGLNNRGQVVGEYFDTTANPLIGTFDVHGFLLSHGQYTTLDDPNATGGVTAAASINDSDQIVGAYLDANSVWHGFVFANDRYTTLDDPNAGTGAFQGTEALGINAYGDIVGWYEDANNVTHAFVLAHGQYTTLDDPNAGTGAGQGTIASGINAWGEVVGWYTDGNNITHGFVFAHGQYTTLDDANAAPGAFGTEGYGINDWGQIVGSYMDANNTINGFLANPAYLDDDLGASNMPASASSLNGAGGAVNVLVAAAPRSNAAIPNSLVTSAASTSGLDLNLAQSKTPTSDSGSGLSPMALDLAPSMVDQLFAGFDASSLSDPLGSGMWRQLW